MSNPSQQWIWAGAALLCYLALMFVQPWRRQFGEGWRFARRWQRTWLIIGLIAAHQVWWQARGEPFDLQTPKDFQPAFAAELLSPTMVEAGDSVAETLTLVIAPQPVSGIVALAFFVNWGGLGVAMHRGCVIAFPRLGKSVFWLLLLSAAAHVAHLAGELSGRIDALSLGGKLLHWLGLPWIGATAALALGWLVRFVETELRTPEEVLQIQWIGSAAGRIARLWPYTVGAACWAGLQPWWDQAGDTARWWLRGTAWTLSSSLAFLPLLLVHWQGEWGWRAPFRQARIRLMQHALALFAWSLLAWLHFVLFHLAADGIASGLPQGNVWRLGWTSFAAFIHSALLVWLAAAWIATQLSFGCSLDPVQKES